MLIIPRAFSGKERKLWGYLFSRHCKFSGLFPDEADGHTALPAHGAGIQGHVPVENRKTCAIMKIQKRSESTTQME